MTRKVDEFQVMQTRLVEASRAVRQYAGSDASLHMIEMIDALGACYCQDLISVTVDGLVPLQSALKQIYAIRAILANDGQDIPKI